MALTKIRMKVKLKVAAGGGIVDAHKGDAIEVADFTADGLVEQGLADYVKEGTMTRTVEPEAKAEKASPENKDEVAPPKDKREGWGGKRVRVRELAKQLNASVQEILFQAAQTGAGATTGNHALTPEEADAIIKALKD